MKLLAFYLVCFACVGSFILGYDKGRQTTTDATLNTLTQWQSTGNNIDCSTLHASRQYQLYNQFCRKQD